MSSWSEGLPEILTRSDFAALVGRTPRGIQQLSARGLAADPTHLNHGRYVWEKATAVDWFRTLHDHAVVVPVIGPIEQELAEYGAYLCPLDSAHVALARPRFLATYQRGGGGRIFNVDAVETVHQQIPGTRSASAATRSIVRDGQTLDDSQHPWTVFHLGGSGPLDRITPAIRRGRYVPIAHIRAAASSGSLVVPPLDERFPART